MWSFFVFGEINRGDTKKNWKKKKHRKKGKMTNIYIYIWTLRTVLKPLLLVKKKHSKTFHFFQVMAEPRENVSIKINKNRQRGMGRYCNKHPLIWHPPIICCKPRSSRGARVCTAKPGCLSKDLLKVSQMMTAISVMYYGK